MAFYGIHISRQRGDKAAYIARTAGTAEPRLTLVLPRRFQWIRVEEAISLKAHACKQPVVEGTLQYVIIFGVAVEQEQAVVHIYIADGRAGLTVGAHVGQLVIGTESLAVGSSTDASRDIELFAHDVVPNIVDSPNIGGVAR